MQSIDRLQGCPSQEWLSCSDHGAAFGAFTFGRNTRNAHSMLRAPTRCGVACVTCQTTLPLVTRVDSARPFLHGSSRKAGVRKPRLKSNGLVKRETVNYKESIACYGIRYIIHSTILPQKGMRNPESDFVVSTLFDGRTVTK